MSLEARKWAESKCGIAPTDRWVLWWLADRLNDDTGRCDPQREWLAHKVGVHVSTVKRAIKSLRRCGLIDWIERRNPDGTNRSHAYTLNLESRAFEQTPYPANPNESDGVNLNLGDGNQISHGPNRASATDQIVSGEGFRMVHEPLKTEPIKKEPRRGAASRSTPEVVFSNETDQEGESDAKAQAFAEFHRMFPTMKPAEEKR